MAITRTAHALLPALAAVTAAAWCRWLIRRHTAPVADVWLSGYEAGRRA